MFLGRSSVFIRCERFLTPRAQELELEDHQSRLQQKLRQKMLKEGEYSDVCLGPCEGHFSPERDLQRARPKAGALPILREQPGGEGGGPGEVEAHRPPSKALLASFTWAVWAALDSIPQANRTIQFIHFPIYSV